MFYKIYAVIDYLFRVLGEFMTNFDRDEAVMKFARQLRGMGVDEALRARGAKDGDLVRIGKFEFEFVD